MIFGISWKDDPHASWYVIERRASVAPLYEGPGATPWMNASGKLEPGVARYLVHFPVLGGQLKNIFRVTAYNSGGKASSAPVAEYSDNKAVQRQVVPR